MHHPRLTRGAREGLRRLLSVYTSALAAVGLTAGIWTIGRAGWSLTVVVTTLLICLPMIAWGLYAPKAHQRWRQILLPTSFLPMALAAILSGSVLPAGLASSGLILALAEIFARHSAWAGEPSEADVS